MYEKGFNYRRADYSCSVAWYQVTGGDNGTNSSSVHYAQASFCLIPPPKQEVPIVQLIAGLYALLFVIGFAGNIAVLQSIWFIQKSARRRKASAGTRTGPLAQKDTSVVLYVVALCCVDLAVILSIPLNISHLLVGEWLFGTIGCKLHYLTESVSKILSTFVLTAMSFDRFLGVCHPFASIRGRRLRSPKVAVGILIASIIVAVSLLFPLPYHAEAVVHKLAPPFVIDPMSQTYGQFALTGCSDRLEPRSLFIKFTVYIFLIGFVAPAILITTFYALILKRLRAHKRQCVSSSAPVGKVTRYASAVTGFYFFCWTPFWVSVIYHLYLEAESEGQVRNDNFVFLMLLIHALPFLNSSLNWLFYATMNTKLQRGYHAATSISCQEMVFYPVSQANGHTPTRHYNRHSRRHTAVDALPRQNRTSPALLRENVPLATQLSIPPGFVERISEEALQLDKLTTESTEITPPFSSPQSDYCHTDEFL